MRILLIAYNYPPLASPQAIRWYYLSRELVRHGAEVHVLAPDIQVRPGASLDVPAGIAVHRCDAGGLSGWLARARRRRLSGDRAALHLNTAAERQAGATTLNWKGRCLQRLQRWIGLVCFPDHRGLWRHSARVELDRLLEDVRPDVLVSSHEPAVTLELGMRVATRVPAWLVDLGDPVLTPYTPAHWRRRAAKVEGDVCRAASAIIVTTEDARELLRARHRADVAKIFVLSQGFDDCLPRSPDMRTAAPGHSLHLLYSGRFYPFRDPVPLLDAVVALDRLRLTVIAPEVKPELLAYAARSGGRIAFVGEQSHEHVLAWQRECDVLVNIGNAMQAQIPGKLYEYLGSGKPILHCQSAEDDPAVTMLDRWRCGWSCRNERTALQALLTKLLDSPSLLADAAVGDAEAIARHGWSRLGNDLYEHCRRLAEKARSGDT